MSYKMLWKKELKLPCFEKYVISVFSSQTRNSSFMSEHTFNVKLWTRTFRKPPTEVYSKATCMTAPSFSDSLSSYSISTAIAFVQSTMI